VTRARASSLISSRPTRTSVPAVPVGTTPDTPLLSRTPRGRRRPTPSTCFRAVSLAAPDHFLRCCFQWAVSLGLRCITVHRDRRRGCMLFCRQIR
jgi:hypothetical protein